MIGYRLFFLVLGVLVTPSSALAGGPVELRYQFEVGDVSHYLHEITSKTEMGEGMDQKEVNSRELRFEVLSVDKEKNATIQIIVTRLRVKGPMIDYDSKDPDSAFAFDVRPSLNNAFVKKPFILRITSRGEVLEFSGVDSLMKPAFEKVKADQPSLAPTLDQFKDLYTDRTFRLSFNDMFPVLPAAPVKIGEKWTHKALFPVPMIGDLPVTSQLALMNATGIITDQIQLESIEKDLQLMGQEMHLVAEKGTGSAVYSFGIETGQIQTSVRETTQKFQLVGGAFAPVENGGVTLVACVKQVLTVLAPQ